MKNILFYSPDLNLCASLMMFFGDRYLVTTSTNIEAIEQIANSVAFDLLILDAEPDKSLAELCKKINKSENPVPIILTYVYTSKFRDMESNLKNYIEAIFYKPFELNEVSQKIDKLLVQLA